MTIQTAFNHGIWGPRLNNRSDIDSYYKACRQVENFQVFPQGGVTFRPGFEWFVDADPISYTSLLIPYQHSSGENYMLEVAHEIILVYSEAGLQDTITYIGVTQEMLDDLSWSQSGDDVYFAVKGRHPFKLLRLNNNAWRVVDTDFYPYPQKTKSIPCNSELNINSTTGNNRPFTFGSSRLYEGDVGKWIVADSPHRGRGIISRYTSSTAGNMNIVETFSGTSIPIGYSHFEGHGRGSMTPERTGPEGVVVTVTASRAIFRADQTEGTFVEINDGVIRLTGRTSNVAAEGEILKVLKDTELSRSWYMSQEEWVDGHYPETIGYFENRMFYAGTDEKPNFIWGTCMYQPKNFTSHANDEFSVMYKIQGRDSHKIQWLMGNKVLVIGTTNGIWRIGQDRAGIPVTPTNPIISKRSSVPAAKIRPITLESSIIFVQRNKEKIIEMDAGVNAEEPADLTILASPFSSSNTIVAMVAQKSPEQIVWVVDSAGDLWGMNYNISQQVKSWFKVVTDGEFQSIAVFPKEDSPDELWVVIKRTLNGTVKRTIERVVTDQYLDCSKTYTGGSTSTLTGFTHFPSGTTVSVVTAEDDYIGEYTVDGSGQVDISPYSSAAANVGLKYEGVLQTMNWGVVKPGGKDHNCLRRSVDMRLSLLDAKSGQVAYQLEQDGPVDYQDIFAADKATAWSGTIDKSLLTGSGREVYFYVKQDKPLPLALLALDVRMK